MGHPQVYAWTELPNEWVGHPPDMTGTAEIGKIPSGLVADILFLNISDEGMKVIPLIGNAASAYSAYLDWNKMWSSYDKCMEHF
jgi:hypothetical protein